MNVHLLNSPVIIAFFFLLIGMSLGYFFARRKISKKQLEEHTKINVEREILEEKLKFIEDRNVLLQEMFPHCDLMPGVLRLLLHLKLHGVPMAIATSSHKKHFDLKTTKHTKLFDEIFRQLTITMKNIQNSSRFR